MATAEGGLELWSVLAMMFFGSLIAGGCGSNNLGITRDGLADGGH
jgi:hypothetical protein